MSTYLVTQATGGQSQWVITHLLAASLKVHAVVRNTQKVPPVLKSPGVTLFQGESTDFDVILKAAQGCKAAFLNTFPIPGLEAQQAKTIVEACEKAGVESIVAATTFTTGKRAFWDDEKTDECQLREYFVSKAQVEDIVRGGNFKAYTILRPAILHQDFLLPGAYQNYPKLPQGILDHAFNDGVKAPFTDAQDVGRYAAAAMQDPAKFAGQEIDLATEALTMEEAHDILTKVSGREVGLRRKTPEEEEEAKAAIFGQRFQLFANVKDFSAHVVVGKELEEKFGIPYTPLLASLQRDKARLLECLPA
ncbi:NmrA-like family protein [Pochonia chlamydosporia 170]|uniref:NmrA-like family protein n=1 Tax=Pochonia chlamydosporia 170 TaxID=1380566 RepID=A0A179FQ46_METCM|nr:NmrA-like family protein [Pochonia chlamydosporia 170]OAQ67193.1 NmrA-like family protein [Pochonia chlamydosporia 170]